MAHHVFITHAVEDKTIAEFVCEGLESNGIQCWIAPRDIPYGMNFEEAIVDAITDSSLMILILSSHSNNSPHVKREIQIACMEDAQTPVLPFRIEDIRLNKALQYYLGSTQWLDASTPPLESHLDNLVKRVRVYRPQEKEAEAARQRAEAEVLARQQAEAEVLARRVAEEELTLMRSPIQEPDQRTVEPAPFSEPEQPIERPSRRVLYLGGGAALALAIIIVAAVAYTSSRNTSPQSLASVPAESNSPQIDQVSDGSKTSENKNINSGVANPPVNSGASGPDGGGGGGYDRVFTSNEVTTKARLLTKPEPEYTEDARKNQVTGTVVLRVVFASNGTVTNIRTISGLPHGLTERAIVAARQIKFVPAIKDRHKVSMWMQLEYNFNLY
jgi:TonB family protein